MHSRFATPLLAILLTTSAHAVEPRFVFRDVGATSGLFPHLEGIQGHAAGWGDVDGDGRPDLYVATFHKADGKPNQLFRNDGGGRFRLDDQPTLRLSTRASAALFADLDNDGRPELYVSSMPQPANRIVGCSLFRNDGGLQFTNISEGNGACPTAFGGRSATVLDFDGDGLLDLLVGEEPNRGYNGSETRRSRLFRNLGGLRFADAAEALPGPADLPGLGVAVGDVNDDGRPDFFLAAQSGGNVLYLNDGKGKFFAHPESRKLFDWPGAGGDNMIAGACFADVNRDGLLDLIVGQHYKQPWREPVPIRLYLHRGVRNGLPAFEDVTEAAGLRGIPMKAPHVEAQDFDNDGWPDLLTSVVKFRDGQPHPLIYRGLGVRDGVPRFAESAWAVNDFPTRDDLAVRRSGDFFAKVLKDHKVLYTAPGPSADFDGDGRLDLFLPSWWPEARSLLLRNETPGGHWLDVRVEGGGGVNRMGIGARVQIYPTEKLGDATALLGCREIATGYGYASGQPAEAHFGLGAAMAVDVEVTLPHGKGVLTRKGVRANQKVTIRVGGTGQ